MPSALPSALIGWSVAVRCVTVAVSVADSAHWLARCRLMRHRCRQRCRHRSLAGALPSDASQLPSALPSALIGWRVAVRCVTVAVSVAVSPHWLALSRQRSQRCRITTLSRTPKSDLVLQGNRPNRLYARDHPSTPAKIRNLDKTMQSRQPSPT